MLMFGNGDRSTRTDRQECVCVSTLAGPSGLIVKLDVVEEPQL